MIDTVTCRMPCLMNFNKLIAIVKKVICKERYGYVLESSILNVLICCRCPCDVWCFGVNIKRAKGTGAPSLT